MYFKFSTQFLCYVFDKLSSGIFISCKNLESIFLEIKKKNIFINPKDKLTTFSAQHSDKINEIRQVVNKLYIKILKCLNFHINKFSNISKKFFRKVIFMERRILG